MLPQLWNWELAPFALWVFSGEPAALEAAKLFLSLPLIFYTS